MKWISTLLLTLSIFASVLTIRPARAEAPLPPEKPAAAQNLASNEALPPILLKIAFCESGNRQFDSTGRVLHGRVNPEDIGRFQINLPAHAAEAATLGLDLQTWQGNTEFAAWLYRKEGTAPWIYSRSCWTTR